MFRLLDAIFPREPFEMPLSCQRSVAVRRLKGQLIPLIQDMFSRHDRGGVGGKVTNKGVRLYRTHNSAAAERRKFNSWKPWLRASFVYVNGQLHLRGRFTMHPLVKIFSGFWLGGIAFIVVYSFFLFLFGPMEGRQNPVPFFFPLGAAAFGYAGWLLMMAAWRWSEDDMVFIEKFIDRQIGPGAQYD